MSHPDNDMHDTHRFDQTLRELHAIAVERVSPATRRALQAARTRRPHARTGYRGLAWAGAAVATVCAVAIGLSLDSSSRLTPAPSTLSTAITTLDRERGNDESAITALDENPDLYVWLASNEDAWLAAQ